MEEKMETFNSGGNDIIKEAKTWSHNSTLTLLDLYKSKRGKVGSFHLKNLKQLWEVIASKVKQTHNTQFSAANCENRWRVLERNYKKVIDNNNKTGRGRKFFEYQNEMDDIFGKKRNIHPELLLSSDTIHVVAPNVEIVMEPDAENLKSVPEEIVDLQSEFPAESELEKTNLEKTKTLTTPRRKRTQSRNCTLQLMRQDKKIHNKELIDIQRERLEIEKQKLIEKQTRNQLIKERNEILKMYLNYFKLELPNDLI